MITVIDFYLFSVLCAGMFGATSFLLERQLFKGLVLLMLSIMYFKLVF